LEKEYLLAKEAKEKNIPIAIAVEKLFCHGLKHLTGIHHK
jgi:ssRNA-specific RNase YbeY (16S rRNA maturation enzyme)